MVGSWSVFGFRPGLGDEEAAALDDGEAIAQDAPTVLRHYTTSDRAEQILRDGQINPSADGYTYLTPNVYTDGQSAQSGLALSHTPEVIFRCRLRLERPRLLKFPVELDS